MDEVKSLARHVCDAEELKRLSHQAQQYASSHLRLVIYSLLGLAVAIWAMARLTLRSQSQSKRPHPPPRTTDVEKRGTLAATNKSKFAMSEPGVWTPSPFKRPVAAPYPDWCLATTKPLPYRPFRPKYYVTMGMRSMSWDEWIELDNEYPKYHALKATRLTSRGTRSCQTAPEAYEAALELLSELTTYLPQRYPSLYVATDTGVANVWSDERFDVSARPLPEDPMAMAARLVQDDLAIMLERPDGKYYLLAGAILLAGFWRLEDKFGMPLGEIHASGGVPQFEEKLERGMDNLFRRMRPEAPMLRNNYFIQVDDGLAWSESIGSEDDGEVNWDTAEKGRAIEHHYFRSERQSLRRLPKTGAIIFTVRTYFHPITAICAEPYVPGRLARAVRSWSADVARYRGRARYGDVLLEYLDARHAEQVGAGLDVSAEEELYKYPY